MMLGQWHGMMAIVGGFLMIVASLIWKSTSGMPGDKAALRLNVATLFGILGVSLVIIWALTL
jgi:hypothetical protein